MVPEKIFDILKDFTNNDYKSILIDGVWGIGKTYQINRFLKEYVQEKKNKKKLNVLYVSLFGKENIVDIHSELCIKGHPKKFKAKNIMKYAFETINMAASIIPIKKSNISLDFNLGIPKNKEIKSMWKHRKKINIVIIDDLERKSLNLSYDTILGYLNQLFLDNIKVVIICSEKEISKNDEESFRKFKEKVFDRFYSISRANEDVIRDYFQDDSSFLDNEIIGLYNNNLRIVSKTAKFYFEVQKKLVKKEMEFSKGTLLWYCSLIVVEFNSYKYLEEVKRSDLLSFEFRNQSEETKLKLKSIYEYDEKIKHPFRATRNNELIEGVYQAYFCNDYEKLYSALTPKNSPKTPILEQDEFFLDVEGKKKLLEEKFKYIYESNEVVFDRNLLITINNMFEYKKYFPNNYSDVIFAEFLAKKYVDVSNELFASCQLLSTTYSKDFFNILIEKNTFLFRNKMLNKLKNGFEKEDCLMVDKAVQQIRSINFTKKENNESHKGIQDFIKENSFFVPSLAGNINQKVWRLAREACDVAIYLELSLDLKKFLERKLILTEDEDEQARIKYLLAYYFQSNGE